MTGDSSSGDSSEAPAWLVRVLRPETRSVLAPGTLVTPRYRVQKQLGAGGFGVVYQALDRVLQRKVALKMIEVAPMGGTPLRTYVAAFLREARLTSHLVHPNIVIVHDVGRTRTRTPFMVTELLAGKTLREALDPQIELRRWLSIMLPIADALAFAHEQGVVHRDLKPENVMVAAETIKVLDFGIAQSIDRASATSEQREQLLARAGTPGYMAPEQIEGGAQSAQTDLYALGVLMYEALTGRRPVSDAGETKPLQAWRPDAPAGLAELIARCRANDPADRPASAREVAELLSRHERISRARAHEISSGDSSRKICPFPGLNTFEETLAPYFFGRDGDSVECAKLADDPHRWIFIEGPSGVGKSSFVRAALLPLLRARWASDTIERVLRPGSDLGAALGTNEDAEALLRAPQPVILVLDQFEELALGGPAARKLALEFLHRFLQERSAPSLLVTTVRSDLIPELLAALDLTRLLNRAGRRYVLPPIAGDRLREVIEGPATLAGIHLEEGLAELLLRETDAARAGLPLLAQILYLLWEQKRGSTFERAAYERIGGIGACVARWAEQIYAAIGAPDRMRDLLLAAITIRDGIPAGKPLSMGDAIAAAGGDTRGKEIVEACLGPRALFTKESDGDRVVLVHDAVIEAWPRLVEWIALHRRAIAARDDLEAAAVAWQSAGKIDDGLARGGQLEYFSGAAEGSSIAAEFLRASKERAAQAIRAREREQRRRQAAIVLAAATLAAIGGWTLSERAQADRLREESASIARRATELVALERRPGTLELRTDLGARSAAVLGRISAETRTASVAIEELRLTRLRMRDLFQDGQFREMNAAFDRAMALAEEAMRDPASANAVRREAGLMSTRTTSSLREARGMEGASDAAERGIGWLEEYLEVAGEDADVELAIAFARISMLFYDALRVPALDGRYWHARCGPIVERYSTCATPKCDDLLGRALTCRAFAHQLDGNFADLDADLASLQYLNRRSLELEPTLERKRDLAFTERDRARASAAHGDFAAAAEYAGISEKLFREISAENKSEEYWYAIEGVMAHLARAELEQLRGDIPAARSAVSAAMGVLGARPADTLRFGLTMWRTDTVARMAELAIDEGDALAAEVLIAAAIDEYRPLITAGDRYAELDARVWLVFARVERALGRPALAADLLAERDARWKKEAEVSRYPPVLLRHGSAQLELAALYCALEARAAARTAIVESVAVLKFFAERDPLDVRPRAELDAAARLRSACAL